MIMTIVWVLGGKVEGEQVKLTGKRMERSRGIYTQLKLVQFAERKVK